MLSDRAQLVVVIGLGLGPGAPEIFLAFDQAGQPPGKEAAGDPPGPGVLLVLVGGLEAAARRRLDGPHEDVDDDVAADAGDHAVGDGVGEGHDGDGQEGWDSVAHVAPVDLDDGAHHHGPDEDQYAAGCPRRDGREDGREEDGNEEADPGGYGRDARLAALADTGTALDEGGYGRGTEKGANTNTDRVDEVRGGGALKILGLVVDQVGEPGHGIQGTSAIEDVDVEEYNQSTPKLEAVSADVPVLHGQDAGDGVEPDNPLEEVKVVVANGGVGEDGDLGVPRPRDDRHDEDTGDDGTLEPEHGENNGQEATAEDTKPEGGVAHLVRVGARPIIEHRLGWATCQGQGRGDGSLDQTDTLAVGQTDECQEETDAGAGRKLDGARDGPSEPLAKTENGQAEEDEALGKDGGHSDLVRYGSGAVEADNLVGEVGVEAHTSTDAHRPVTTLAAGRIRDLVGCASTYMLASRPRKKVARQEMAAVPVTRSLLTSFLQRR